MINDVEDKGKYYIPTGLTHAMKCQSKKTGMTYSTFFKLFQQVMILNKFSEKAVKKHYNDPEMFFHYYQKNYSPNRAYRIFIEID